MEKCDSCGRKCRWEEMYHNNVIQDAKGRTTKAAFYHSGEFDVEDLRICENCAKNFFTELLEKLK